MLSKIRKLLLKIICVPYRTKREDNMLFKRPVIEYGNGKALCAWNEEVYEKELLN
jgi:hypothetical protein